jgi:hypothetical protein
MEMVSRGEAVTLRAATAQTAQLVQIANNPLLADLNIAPKVLGAPLRLMEGAASRTDLVNDLVGLPRRHRVLFLRGSTGLRKTSLAPPLVDKIGGGWVWAGFRERDPRQIAGHLKRAALIHAFIAKSDWALLMLVKGVLTLEQEALRAIGDGVFWFPAMALEPGQQLSLNLSTDFMLRLAEFRTAAADGQTDRALLIMERTLELLVQFDHQELAQWNDVRRIACSLTPLHSDPVPSLNPYACEIDGTRRK